MKVLFLQNDPFFRVGLMALAGYLHEHNHEVESYVYRGNRADQEFIQHYKPDLIGFYVTSADTVWTLNVCQKLKWAFPGWRPL